jgi:hypothetical protein
MDLSSSAAVETLRDRRGHIVGHVERQGARLVLKNRHGHLLGSYDADGYTRDRQGHVVGYGNLLGTLLRGR